MKPDSPPRDFTQSIIGNDRLDIDMIGAERPFLGDLYHTLTRLSWPVFFVGFIAAFIAFNFAFAALYALDPNGLSRPDTLHFSAFWHAFFFSVHTVATVGYGDVFPLSTYANVLVVIEITIGVLFFALTSGIMFARFSRPSARILFSNVAIIKTFEGVPTLMFRVGNQRGNFILEASIRVSILRRETVDGNDMRRFYTLPLVRSMSQVFAMSWLVMHRIDEDSPLFGRDASSYLDGADEIVVTLTGTDASVIQPVHARHAYSPGAVLFDHDFVDVISVNERGRRVINYTLFHDVVALSHV